jgi:CHASE3 domain sensor protein
MITRVFFAVVAVSLLFLGLGAGAAWYVHRLQRNTSDMLDINVSSMRAAEELEIGIREMRHRLQRFLVTRDADQLAALPELRHQIDRWLQEAERVATTEREQVWMRQCRHGYERLLAELQPLAVATPSPQQAGRVDILVEGLLTNEIIPPVHAYLDFNEEAVLRESRSNQALADRLVLGFLTIGASIPLNYPA